MKIPNHVSIPEISSSFKEIAKQMRINTDIIKQEITDHVNAEITRLRRELEEIKGE